MTVRDFDSTRRAGAVNYDLTIAVRLDVNVPVRGADNVIAVDIEIPTKLRGAIYNDVCATISTVRTI
jgi:Pyruvate/2-oxoacid:ferredoxin oxidoreductase gamma subunit